MPRMLAIGLVLLATTEASVQPPAPRTGETIPRDIGELRARQKETQERDALMRELQQAAERRAARPARLAVRGVMVGGVWTDEQIEAWAFRPYSNAAAARQQLESQLASRILDIEGTCRLTYTQMKKLRLAGQGDIKRFFDRYETVKQQVKSMKRDELMVQNISHHVAPLQMRLQAGLFQEDSLMVKSLRNTLTGEQFARYDATARERRASGHRQSIEQVVSILERSAPLRAAQRRELITVIARETKPPRISGPYDISLLLLQLSRLPDAKLKRLFDPDQWDIVSQQLDGYGQMEPTFKQAGLMPVDEDEADSVEEGRRP